MIVDFAVKLKRFNSSVKESYTPPCKEDIEGFKGFGLKDFEVDLNAFISIKRELDFKIIVAASHDEWSEYFCYFSELIENYIDYSLDKECYLLLAAFLEKQIIILKDYVDYMELQERYTRARDEIHRLDENFKEFKEKNSKS